MIFVPPQSKSDAQRALIVAQITGAPAPALDDDLPSDVARLRAGLDAISSGIADLECGDGGAPFRFLLTQAALTARVPTRLWGTERLAQRPHAALATALGISLSGARLSVVSEPGDRVLLAEVRPLNSPPTSFTISSDDSSQFASSLLLGAAVISHGTHRPFSVRVEGARVSDGYLQMTIRWLRAAGFEVTGETTFAVSFVAARPLPAIPGDWSSLGYLLLLAWAFHGTVSRLSDPWLHPDGAIVAELVSVGLTLHDDGSVTGTPRGHLDVSAASCPDSIPTLAALACMLPEPSRFSDCGILRGKESDRVEGIAALARAAGATIHLDHHTLTLTPPLKIGPLHFDSRGDHRLAMAAGTLAALARVPLQLRGMESVQKSFPGFWRELAKTGTRVEPLR